MTSVERPSDPSDEFEKWAKIQGLDLELDHAGYAKAETYWAYKAFLRAVSWCRSGPTSKCYRGGELPQDCDAPFCGCNPAWHDAIEMLQECGWTGPAEELQE